MQTDRQTAFRLYNIRLYSLIMYRIARNIEVEFSLTIFTPTVKLISIRQINIHQHEFIGYYKPLALYHFVKLKFIKCYFQVNLSNLFPVNISSYRIAQNFGRRKLWWIWWFIANPPKFYSPKSCEVS